MWKYILQEQMANHKLENTVGAYVCVCVCVWEYIIVSLKHWKQNLLKMNKKNICISEESWTEEINAHINSNGK